MRLQPVALIRAACCLACSPAGTARQPQLQFNECAGSPCMNATTSCIDSSDNNADTSLPAYARLCPAGFVNGARGYTVLAEHETERVVVESTGADDDMGVNCGIDYLNVCKIISPEVISANKSVAIRSVDSSTLILTPGQHNYPHVSPSHWPDDPCIITAGIKHSGCTIGSTAIPAADDVSICW
jgi:hypothetical protein